MAINALKRGVCSFTDIYSAHSGAPVIPRELTLRLPVTLSTSFPQALLIPYSYSPQPTFWGFQPRLHVLAVFNLGHFEVITRTAARVSILKASSGHLSTALKTSISFSHARRLNVTPFGTAAVASMASMAYQWGRTSTSAHSLGSLHASMDNCYLL